MRVVVLTDRRLVRAVDDIPGRLAAILAACPTGSVAIQIREKDLDGGPLLALTRAVVALACPAGASVWVNDRSDIALAAGADGVHLPEHGLSIADTRTVARRLLVGCSRHTLDAVQRAATEGANLVQYGPVWSVPGKSAPIGLDALGAARRTLPDSVRLVAVGGIDSPERAEAATSAGADAVAIIRAAWQSSTAPALVAQLVAAASAGASKRTLRR